MDQSHSEADWILCFAVIKRRNPDLWRKTTKGAKEVNKFRKVKSLSMIVPDRLSGLILKQSLFAHLDIVYRYRLNYKKLGNNLKVIKSLSDDIKQLDIIRWFLPNYKNILAVLSLDVDVDVKEQGSLYYLYVCFQTLISSYSCLQVTTHQCDDKFITETLLSKFISNELFFMKQQNSKVVQQYLKNDSSEKFNMRKMLMLHCRTLSSILNLLLKSAEYQLMEGVNYELRFFLIVGKICYIIESLAHCLINQQALDERKEKKGKKLAYYECYSAREKEFDFQYTNSVLFILREKTADVKERMMCLKWIIVEFLRMFRRVDWSRLDDYVNENPIHIESMAKRRIFIQASLMVIGDLTLIAEFRLASWPSWGK